MPEPSYHQFLQTVLPQQQDSIANYQLNDQKVWIKKASKHNSIWLYRLAGLGAKLLGIEALAPVPSTGGKKAIVTEAKRLQNLGEHQINVPQVLASCEYGLMISDLGGERQEARQLDSFLLRQANAAQCWHYFTQTVDALLHTHQRGMWLSEAFIRNIVIDQHDQIGFVDFETEPLDYLDQQSCFARDWIHFIYSVAIRLDKHAQLAPSASYLQQALAQESRKTQDAVYLSCARLSFLHKLPVKYFGKDGQRLAAAAILFRLLTAQQAEIASSTPK